MMRKLIAACVLPAALSGCGFQTLVGPLLGGVLGGGGGSTTLTLQIDQAHGTLTMGNSPAPTVTSVGMLSPVSGTPTPVEPTPIAAPKPVPVVP